jgi:protein SCO1/2
MRKLLAWTLLAVSTAVALALLARERLREPLPVVATLPHFELVERDGSTVTLAELAGRPWVADFVFTRCQVVCPYLTGKMAELRRRLPAGSRLASVSISVDPEHDTPEVLRVYAEGKGISGRDWLFLTGERDAVRGLIRDGFLLAVEDTPDNVAMPVMHSSRFALVDGAGRIRGYYSPLEQDSELDRLIEDAAALEREAREEP